MKTVLVTGCSSGFGLEIARFFLAHGWKVIATMRTRRQDLLPISDHLKIVALDVTSPESIRAAVETAGPVDVLVNNAGIGWLNAVEGTPMEIARDVFETNTLGTIAMTQAVLPLLSVYTASKAAVNAFTESAALELEPFNVRVRIVLPGRAPETRFGDTARSRLQQQGGFPEAYSSVVADVFASWEQQSATALTQPVDVVEAVWRAATDPSSPLRIPAGVDAEALAV